MSKSEISYERLFSTSPVDVARARQNEFLDNYLPEGYTSLAEVDNACLSFLATRKLVILDNDSVRKNMGEIKDPSISRGEFQRISMNLINLLTLEAAKITHAHGENRKAAISVRGGTPFEGAAIRFMPGIQYGFSEQARDETTLKATSTADKLGMFTGLHCVAMDFMLATGGSLKDMTQKAIDREANGVTVVAGFSSPQGIVQMAQIDEVERVISLPLEAGLNYIDEEHHGYIVGGHTPFSMLGDFGDRFCGNTN
jgi:uracil phosphoribosyltransferase